MKTTRRDDRQRITRSRIFLAPQTPPPHHPSPVDVPLTTHKPDFSDPKQSSSNNQKQGTTTAKRWRRKRSKTAKVGSFIPFIYLFYTAFSNTPRWRRLQ